MAARSRAPAGCRDGPCPSGQQGPKLEGAETGFLPCKKAIFFFPERQRRQTGIQPSLFNPSGPHRGVVALHVPGAALSPPRFHVAKPNPEARDHSPTLSPGTPAALGWHQPRVVSEQSRLCKSFAQTAETWSMRETRAGENGLYRGKRS